MNIVVPPEVVNFLIILGGVLWRTVRPWMKKYKKYIEAVEKAEEDGEPEPDPKEFGLSKYGIKFKRKFWVTGGFSFVSILVVAVILGALQQDPTNTGLPLFFWAIGQTEVINREIL